MHFGKIRVTPSLYAEWLAAEVDGWAPTLNGGAQATVAFEYTADEAKEWRQIARANSERSKARRRPYKKELTALRLEERYYELGQRLNEVDGHGE